MSTHFRYLPTRINRYSNFITGISLQISFSNVRRKMVYHLHVLKQLCVQKCIGKYLIEKIS